MSSYVYSLTSLTGRQRNVGRTAVISGFEVNRRTLIVAAVAVGVSLIPTLVLGSLFGPIAFIATPAVIVAATFILVEGRTRKGLKVRVYQSYLDKKRADVNDFYICFRPIGRDLGDATIVSSSIPVARPTTNTAAPVLGRRAKKQVAAPLGVAALMESTGV